MEAKCLPPVNMVSTSTQNSMSVIRDLQIPLVSTLWLVVYSDSDFLFSALSQNFFDLCTDTFNLYFAEGTWLSRFIIKMKIKVETSSEGNL